MNTKKLPKLFVQLYFLSIICLCWSCKDPCKDLDCQNGGSCVEFDSGIVQCACPDGFTGEFCEEAIPCFNFTCPDNVTTDSPVYNAATDSCECICADGFFGEFCEDPCENINCNTGNCITNELGVASCDCPDGFFGEFCQNSCEDINCQNGGICIETESGEVVCDCPDGFSGEFCEEGVECFGVVCPENVTEDSPIYDAVDDACYCFCADGYEGADCDIEIRERITGSSTGIHYKAIDACTSGEYEYTVTIVKATSPNNNTKQFIIPGFGGFDALPANVTCEITEIEIDVDGNVSNIKWIIPDHIDTDSDGNRIITSAISPGSSYYNFGTWNPSTGALSITWSVTFFDGETDQCTVILEPF